MNAKIKQIENFLNYNFFEKEKLIRTIMITMVAGQNILLIGAPGTGKSAIIRDVAKCLSGGHHFYYNLSDSTVPEEVFGGIIMDEMGKGSYKRKLEGKAAGCTTLMLDEIGRANSAVKNSALPILNERIFVNDGEVVECQLLFGAGATNDPLDSEEDAALNDRFVVQVIVEDIKDANNFRKYLQHTYDDSKCPQIDIVDIFQMQRQAQTVNIKEDLVNAMVEMREELNKASIHVTTRTWDKARTLIKASAVVSDRQIAEFEDLEILKDCLWRNIEDVGAVQSIVAKYCYDKVTSSIQDIINLADDIYKKAVDTKDTAAGTEAVKKLKQLTADLGKLQKENPGKTAIENAMLSINDMTKQILSVCLGI